MAVKVKLFEAKDSYSDHYVSRSRMAFSFLSQENEMVGPFVDCKDYLNNRIAGFINKQAGKSEYKYQLKYAEVDLEHTRILVLRKDSPQDGHPLLESGEFEKEIKLAINLLNQAEQALHLVKSTYTKVTGVPKEYGQAFLIEGSRRWMLASPMLSLYLFLLRNAWIHKEDQPYIQTIEASTETGSLVVAEAVKWIVKNKYINVFGKSLEKNYPPDVTEDMMHSMGIYTFGLCKYTEYWPHWKFPNKAVAVKPVKAKEKVA